MQAKKSKFCSSNHHGAKVRIGSRKNEGQRVPSETQSLQMITKWPLSMRKLECPEKKPEELRQKQYCDRQLSFGLSLGLFWSRLTKVSVLDSFLP